MKRFKNILVVADEHGWTDAVAGRALWLARANDARVTLVDVAEEQGTALDRLLGVFSRGRAEEIVADVEHAGQDRLEALAAPLRAEGVAVETVMLHGTAFLALIRRVMASGHDLVLKGAYRGPDRPFLRATDLHLLRKCPCPVWILNGETEPRVARIMAAVDPDPADAVRGGLSRTVMELATSLAQQDDARLDVLNAWNVPEEQALRHGMIKMPDH